MCICSVASNFCVTLWTVVCEVPLSTGFSHQVAIFASRESSWPRDWTSVSGISCTARQILYKWATWRALMKNALQEIFPTQRSNPGLLYWRQILHCLSHQGNPWVLDWVVYPFSRGSSQRRNWTRVSCIPDRFFTIWATRKAQIFSSILIFFTLIFSLLICWMIAFTLCLSYTVISFCI